MHTDCTRFTYVCSLECVGIQRVVGMHVHVCVCMHLCVCYVYVRVWVCLHMCVSAYMHVCVLSWVFWSVQNHSELSEAMKLALYAPSLNVATVVICCE